MSASEVQRVTSEYSVGEQNYGIANAGRVCICVKLELPFQIWTFIFGCRISKGHKWPFMVKGKTHLTSAVTYQQVALCSHERLWPTCTSSTYTSAHNIEMCIIAAVCFLYEFVLLFFIRSRSASLFVRVFIIKPWSSLCLTFSLSVFCISAGSVQLSLCVCVWVSGYGSGYLKTLSWCMTYLPVLRFTVPRWHFWVDVNESGLRRASCFTDFSSLMMCW